MSPPTPKTIGRYAVVDRLGHGGMGVVYRGWDPELRRMVAIKVISGSREVPVEDQVFERFAREARSAASLAHPNIVTIHDFGRDAGGRPYLVMELVDGESMAQTIQATRAIDIPRCVALVTELCEGLGYAHAHGVVHRDIKPANLMITAAGVLKILDFGLARLTDDLADPALTQSGAVMGTPQYMSPEQVSGLPADARSDIFSAGAVMYELFTGQSAFGGQSAAVVRLLILHDTPRPMGEVVPGFPDTLAAIVAKAMDKDRSRRYQDMEALAADLREWERDRAAPGDPDDLRSPGRAQADAADDSSPGLDAFLGEWEDAVGRVLAATPPPDAAAAPASPRERSQVAAAPVPARPGRRRPPVRRVVVIGAAIAATLGAAGMYVVSYPDALARVGVVAPRQPAATGQTPDAAPPPPVSAPANMEPPPLAPPAGPADAASGPNATTSGRAAAAAPTGATADRAANPRPAAAATPPLRTPDSAAQRQVAARCTDILQRVGIGEELTASDREFLTQQCRNRSR